MHDYALYIGRFQPFHTGHLSSIRYALSIAKKMIIAIGGDHLSSSPVDPWTAPERKKMIFQSLTTQERKRVKFIFIRDRLYNESLWKENIVNEVALITRKNADIIITGHERDQTSYYLKNFPQWPFIETGLFSDTNATDIRRAFFNNQIISDEQLTQPVQKFLHSFQKKQQFKVLCHEFNRFDMSQRTHVNGLFANIPAQDKVLLRYGNYILLKKHKQLLRKYLFELPLVQEAKLKAEYSRYFVLNRSFYIRKYDGQNKKGRNILYYNIPAHIQFDLKNFKKSEYKWMLFDDVVLHENKMFADTYQVIHAFLLNSETIL